MKNSLKQLGIRTIVALSVGLGAWTSVEAQSITWLGTLGGIRSEAWGEGLGVSPHPLAPFSQSERLSGFSAFLSL